MYKYTNIYIYIHLTAVKVKRISHKFEEKQGQLCRRLWSE